MNPETRTILKVELQDAVEADEVFTTLMGDKVEPRREFIQAYAKKLRILIYKEYYKSALNLLLSKSVV